MLDLALSTPGNVTTTAIAGVALLLGVLLMARGRRDEVPSRAVAASSPANAPATMAHATVEQPEPQSAPMEPAPAPADPDIAHAEFEAAPEAPAADPAFGAEQEAPAEPQRIRLGGARFGAARGQDATLEQAAAPVQPAVGAEPVESAVAAATAEPSPGIPADEAPAEPRRIRLGGARFGSAPPAPPEPAEAGPPAAPELAEVLPVVPDSPPPAPVADEAPAHEGSAKPRRVRLRGARFGRATSEPPAAPPAPPAAAPEPAPADAAIQPAAAPTDPAAPVAPPSASDFRQGRIRLRR